MGQGDWGLPAPNTNVALGPVFTSPLAGTVPAVAAVQPPVYPPNAPMGPQLSELRISATSFPPSYWDPDFLAMLTIAELDPKEWTSIKIRNPPADAADEIDQLIQLQQSVRNQLLAEIVAQNWTFMTDFLRLLMMSPTSRPQTYLLLKIGARVAELTMPFFKNRFNRPRPSQVCPWIMPPLDVPGHPSYPQGHGLMAHLKALCVSEALRDTHPRMCDALTALADRIAWNRVVAGVHYPTDSDGARELALKLIPLVKRSRNFQAIVNDAKHEWPAAF